jgi:2-polyprenyl-3-methyl-5-hydroxy-6-metoxy-1,4-benzoquinol methylase
MDDLPRKYVIRESSHRIHNPFTSENLATLGRALYLPAGTSMLDLACGSGEMLCTWARDHELTGTGVDISTAFIEAAQARVPPSWTSRTGSRSFTGTLRAMSPNGRRVSRHASGVFALMNR